VEDHRPVPHFWIHVPGNPKLPLALRNDAGQVIHKHGGRLLDDLLFYKPNEPNLGYGTVECSAEQIEKITAELKKSTYELVLTADQADARERRRRARAKGRAKPKR
jgi:hypothetical protein